MNARVCGILAIAKPTGSPVAISDDRAAAMRDRMRHRGPDAAGLWRSHDRSVLLAHRRLAVLDTDLDGAGAQPVSGPERVSRSGARAGARAMVYNGELFNDAELREGLRSVGGSVCDTRTVFELLARAAERGDDSAYPEALAALRGMFALVFHDSTNRRLIAARDPLGIKPLYWWLSESSDGPELVIASELNAILAHPAHTPRPDLLTVSAYLSTIRTTLGERTLFAGVRVVRPGEVIEFDLSRPGRIDHRSTLFWQAPAVASPQSAEGRWSFEEWAERVRHEVAGSVRAHLRSDVPACVLLSGGLDSTIIASECALAMRAGDAGARPLGERLRTYAAGHDDGAADSDLAFARLAAEKLGSEHREAHVTREMFGERWAELIERTGVPLSTPNQVAIHEIARTLRCDGQIVALSGEGADELFAGYDLPMVQAVEFERLNAGRASADRGRFQFNSNAWISPELKARLLRPEVWRALEHDHAIASYYGDEFEACRASAGGDADSLESHLRFLRRINLTGLLERFDACTMLEGVEGRTPFADVRVAELAATIPMRWKFDGGGAGSTVADRTKRVLRAAFGSTIRDAATPIPAAILARAKASFPLPFQGWLRDHAAIAERSPFLREICARDALATIAQQPEANWGVAWPVLNIAMWARKWWG